MLQKKWILIANNLSKTISFPIKRNFTKVKKLVSGYLYIKVSEILFLKKKS